MSVLHQAIQLSICKVLWSKCIPAVEWKVKRTSSPCLQSRTNVELWWYVIFFWLKRVKELSDKVLRGRYCSLHSKCSVEAKPNYIKIEGGEQLTESGVFG